MSNPSKVFVLAEDKRQKQLLYRFLVAAGIGPHQMTIEVSPSGQGSAELWIRKNFARQAEKCRARNARAATGMLVMMDADALSVQEHWNELDAALAAENQPAYNPTSDPIARLIPKWSVETWILFLSSNGESKPTISEDKPYKELVSAEQWSESIPEAARTLYAWTKTSAVRPLHLLDSLQRGLDEIPRALAAAG